MNVLKLFFGWPGGGTWSNLLASAEWLAVGAGGVWLFRDRIGRKAAAWWHKHHHEHAIAAHLEALRRHEEAMKEAGDAGDR